MPSALLRQIDWRVVADATDHYKSLGYRYVEVPWVVPRTVIAATAPPGIVPLETRDGVLVGSAEQGLLHMAAEGKLARGRYVAVSACFRDDVVDVLHGRHFVKVELMHLGATTEAERGRVLADAVSFMGRRTPVRVDPNPPGGEPGQVDLVCHNTGVELGSYGLRSALGVSWAYGTGVAEPRFSTVRARTMLSEELW